MNGLNNLVFLQKNGNRETIRYVHGGSVAADISAIASCLDTKRAERWKDAFALREVVWIFVRASSVCERNRTEEKLTFGRRHIPWKVNEENWHVKPRDDE